ncbi:hypothetical protein BJ170DRAFT_681344 [Xylariales sp. AK1849]|nr:hypothetical protein BJ170DRAFT_681344 [Xylariales sp. AK1849]
MADTARPQTPSRRLFKPSTKTKTPTRPQSTTNTPQSNQSTRAAGATTPASGSGGKRFKTASKTPVLVRRFSQASSTRSFTPYHFDDIAESTPLAPLTSKLDVVDGNASDYAASDTTSGTPIGLVDDDVVTPTGTVSKSTDVAKEPSEETSDAMTRAGGDLSDQDSTATGPGNEQSETVSDATEDQPQEESKPNATPDAAPEQSDNAEDDAPETTKPVSDAVDDTNERIDDSADETSQPIDFAKYFADQGNSEMSEFVKALTAQASDGPASAASSAFNSLKDTGQGAVQKARDAVGGLSVMSSNPMEQLPKDDDLVAQPTSDRDGSGTPLDAKDAVEDKTTGHTVDESKPQDNAEEPVGNGSQQLADTSKPDQGGDVVSKATQKPSALKEAGGRSTLSSPNASDVSDKTKGLNGSGSTALDDVEAKTPQKPNTPKATDQANNAVGADLKQATDASEEADQTKTTPSDQNSAKTNGTRSGIQSTVDNMGKPARINKRVDIPLPRPERPTPINKMHMPDVDKLPSTEGLGNVNDLDDPPEEILDPSIHSPKVGSANISPIPKISKVAPITSDPPPDLARLANGLGGNTVDDVGNIVDESGRVLGHATGDLPAMIGKKVADNGEVYGDEGELIGFVTENFTGHPPSKETPLPGGLKVDMNGNILDGSGNIIGKLNKKPGEHNALAPSKEATNGAPKSDTETAHEEEDKSKKKDNQGIPADIFLDVKSTPDGIQLTIRIPTVFKQETKQTTQEL